MLTENEKLGNPEEIKKYLIITEKKIDGIRVPVVANIGANYLDIMRFDRYFSGIKFNTLSGLPEKHKFNRKSQWTDSDDSSARTYIEEFYNIFNKQKYEDAFSQFQHEREYCPIQSKIDSLVWDGEKRVESFLCKWLGADDTPYNRECSRLLFAGGINRAYKAGCKFDDVIVLIGNQGGGKSTVCQWLALDTELYSSIKTISGQKGVESIAGKWIVEEGNINIDELIKYEWERIPHFFYNFYVYKYATGLSAACYIVNSLLEGKITSSDYIEFLKCGKSKSPLDSLKVAGVDLSDKSVIYSAIDMFDGIINEFKDLYFE